LIKNILFYVSAFLLVLTISSCGGETAVNDNSDDPDAEKDIRIRVISNGCAAGTVGDHSLTNLGSITVNIKDANGSLCFQDSFSQNDIAESMKISGIKDCSAATITISGFGSDANKILWIGKSTGLNFKKDKTTLLDIILYPVSGTACLPDPLTIPRFGHTSTLLGDGRILLTGGFTSCTGTNCQAGKSVEIIDVESGTIETLADLQEPRALHTAIPLDDGSVIIVGGVRLLDTVGISPTDYPTLPYSFSAQAVLVERYMPQYPKLNMRNNQLGTNIPSATEILTLSYSEVPFLPFQKIIVDTVSNPALKTVYLIGGISKDGETYTASSKIFAFDITENAETVTLSPVREVAAGEKDGMIMPAAGIYSGSVFAAGGKDDNATAVADTHAASSSTPWEGTGPNLFYSTNLFVDNNLYTFGGFKSDEDGLKENKTAYKWNIGQNDVTSSDGDLLSWSEASFFSEAVYYEKGGYFIVIGGAGGYSKNDNDINLGSVVYQVIDKETFKVIGKPATFNLNFGRVLPKATIAGDDMLFITGGINKLDGSGIPVSEIEINKL